MGATERHIAWDEVDGWTISTVDMGSMGLPGMAEAMGYRYETMIKNDDLDVAWGEYICHRTMLIEDALAGHETIKVALEQPVDFLAEHLAGLFDHVEDTDAT